MVVKPTSFNETFWYSSAWLIGEAALTFKEQSLVLFPISTSLPQVMTFTLAPPEPLRTPIGDRLFRQRVDICCRAEPADLKELTEPTLNALADLLAFHTLRPVAVKQGPFTTAPPGVAEGSHRSISFGTLGRGIHEAPVTIPPDIPATMARLLDLQNSAQSERILRSMRWLRRSFLAIDPFLEFSALAFGLEAIVALLPGATGGHTSISERLRSFALMVPQITELRWKRVGRLRHTLFHGGITETSKSSEMVQEASPIARLVLIAALRAALRFPPDGTPQLPRLPDGYFTDQRMEVNNIVRGRPPDAL
jgi:hypothetical protein